MKHIILTATIIFSLILLSASCKKDKPELEQLPPATQEGRRTFGCLVNGKAFTPKGSPFAGPILSSYYQLLNTPDANGYFFNISGRRDNNNNAGVEGISINSNSLSIKEGVKYSLQNNANKGEIYAAYRIVTSGESNEYITKGNYKGELYISKLDEEKQIVSGTFWFDAVNALGEKLR